MIDHLDTRGAGEKPQPKENLADVVTRAATYAVSRSRGAALVNLGEAELSQEEVVDKLPGHFHHVSTQDILDGKADVPRDKRALVVTGYSRDYYPRRDEENRIQAFIRSVATTGNLNNGEFAVLVLSNSLPHEGIFHDPSQPWFNGPFQGDESVWSIRPLSSTPDVELVRHDLRREIVREPKAREVSTWVNKQSIRFESF